MGGIWYNVAMKAHINYCKHTAFNKWNVVVIAVVVVLVAAALGVVFAPRAAASTATVYIEGRKVSTLDLADEFNPVAVYNGVLVRVNDGVVEAVYRGNVARVSKAGQKIIYPTLGVTVEVE